MASCNCDEGFLQRAGVDSEGNMLPEIRAPQAHDCEYVFQRNALIPIAEGLAVKRSAAKKTSLDREFHAAMEELWVQRKRVRAA